MDRRKTRLLIAAALSGAVAATGAAAHPHLNIAQTAALLIAPGTVRITYSLALSPREGAHVLSHLDRNRDGRLSPAEKSRFAQDLITATQMEVDARRIALRVQNADFPSDADLKRGQGSIRIIAIAAAPAALPGTVKARIGYTVFRPTWFIQPFLAAGSPKARIDRPAPSSVSVTIPAR